MVALDLVNTLTALVLVYIAQGLPLAVMILSEFVSQVPQELEGRRALRRRRRVPHLLPGGCCR